MSQGFNDNMKSLMTFNTHVTSNEVVVNKKEQKNEQYTEAISEWCRITTIPHKAFTTNIIKHIM